MWQSRRLDELMARRKLSNEELAKQSGIASDTTIGRWLTGRSPRFDEVVQLAKFFEVDLRLFSDETAGEIEGGLSDDEQFVLRVVRALHLTGEEAVRRLSGWSAPGTEFRRVVGAIEPREAGDPAATPKDRAIPPQG